MAETVLRVNRLTEDDEASAAELAGVILDDYAMTNKVLRVVNSAIYGRSQEVTTVSRAIVVLGWNPIRSLVLTFKLFDALPDDDRKEHVRKLMGESFCTGMLARNAATTVPSIREEQAFICGLFHHFGELLVEYYLPEAKQEILQLMNVRKKKQSVASRLVLGMNHAELGMSVAEELHFPKLLISCMQPDPKVRSPGHPRPEERLTGLTALSSRLKTVLLAQTPPVETRERVARLVAGYENQFGALGVKPDSIVTQTLEVIEEHATILGLPIRSRNLVEQIVTAYYDEPPAHLAAAKSASPSSASEEPEAILRKGIEEAARTSLQSLNDVLSVVLETMFRGLSYAPVARAVFLIRDPAHPVLRYRCGLGAGLEDAPSWFCVPLDAKHLFTLAMSDHRDLAIPDISAIGVANAYPPMYRARAQANGCVILLPIVIKKKAIGVFFVEGLKPCDIDAKQMVLLRGLRDQVVRRIQDASLLAA